MTLPAEKRRYTIEEYLRLERDSSQKHEFHFGEILAMSGGTPEHSLIATNILGELRSRLKAGRCRVYDSNLRVCVSSTGQYVYPDGTVVCDPLQFDPNDLRRETVTNPRVIVEVLSPSTESYDRKAKFDAYRKIDSLEEYALVSLENPRIEVLLRQTDGSWAITVFTGMDSVAKLRSIQVDLPLAEAFAGVTFPGEAPHAQVSTSNPQ
jgi:Uma2 family endonuclease